MQEFDYHLHTVYSDGHHTAEDMVKSAIKMGLKEIGFSDHSYTPWLDFYCMKPDDHQNYQEEILRLKKKYSDQISIKLGIEQDYYSVSTLDNLDFILGSVHFIYFEECNQYVCIDGKPDKIIAAAEKYCNGDIYRPIEMFYELEGEVVNKTHCDIIAHFDIISKYNEIYPFFNPNHPRYRNAWKKAADQLLETKALFEINTGCISRNYKTAPYPSNEIYQYLKNRGARFILGSDSHDIHTIAFQFEKYTKLVD